MTSQQRVKLVWERLRTRWQQVPSHEREFLPAELEILETPASPAGRKVALLIMALFVMALVWSIMGRVDMNAVAQGKVVPLGGRSRFSRSRSALCARFWSTTVSR